MSVSKVDQFLKESGGNNFTETAPRPPVPGEENETKSNGGMSTQSSGSHKSQVSHTSSRSHCSKQGDTNPATPRKSNLDKTISCSVEGCEELDAPLGFEPEGSAAANSPPFSENSTPPYLKWAENMNFLLEDGDGIDLFRTFLDQEGAGQHSLDFWLACKGLKIKDKVDSEATHVIKLIQKKYIKSDKLPYLKANTKHAIYEKLKSGLDLMIFDVAQAEVEDFMRNNLYPLFIKSDLYIQYVQKGGDSPKSSNSSSGSNSARPLSGPLPPLVEDMELQPDDLNSSSFGIGPPVSKSRPRSHSSEKKHDFYNFSAPYPPYQQQRQVPYHISYAPTSAQDSEIQSLSSQDNLTDDTTSLPDSTVDGPSFRESKRHRKYSKALQRKAGLNPDLGTLIIPRTERAPKDRNIAEVDPSKFAQMLIDRLKVVLEEQEKKERFQVSLNKVDQPELNDTMDRSCISMTSSRNTTSIMPLLTSSLIDDENADSILEEHCSRVWDRSAQQTPSRSPGRHSPPPRPKSPDRTRKVLSQTQPHSGASSMPGTLHMKPLHSKKRTEFYSMSSFDSGVVEDNNKCALETHKHIHHHHHHHHSRDRKSKHKLEMEAQQHSLVCSGTGRKTNIRNHSSDAASNIDSGICLIDPISQPHPATFDSSNTKVLKWMMDNENVNRGVSSTYPDSDKTSSSHNRRSHKTAALPTQVPQQQFKQSASKKCSNSSSSHGNRSASADSSYRLGWGPQMDVGGGSILPNQPFVQDPSMPPLPRPNTTVQLEEVHRRLEAADHAKTAPVKSKSFTGGVGKDRRMGMSMSQSSNQMYPQGMPTTKTVPADMDLSTEMRPEKKMSKRSSGSGNTSTSSRPDETVIGYYFCEEPIPYRITVPQPSVTLGKLKESIGKKGTFRYFFKTHTNNNDFDSDVVWEEIRDDNCFLPVFEGKVVAKVEKVD